MEILELSGQAALRALVVYFAMMLMVRFGAARLRGYTTVFACVVAIILGSLVAGAIGGDKPLFPTLAGALTLVSLHWIFSVLSFHFHWLSPVTKGISSILVERGSIQWDSMRRHHITENDLLEAL